MERKFRFSSSLLMQRKMYLYKSNDQLAKARHNCLGKTEMWFVLDAKLGAYLYSGFNQQDSQIRIYTSRGRWQHLRSTEQT